MSDPLPEPSPIPAGVWKGPAAPPNPDTLITGRGWRLPVGLLALASAILIAILVAIALVGFYWLVSLTNVVSQETADRIAVVVVAVAVAGCLAMFVAATVFGARQRRRMPAEQIQAWANSHGLGYKPAGELPPATPLLARGKNRRAVNLVTGELPGGLAGVAASYFYTGTLQDQGLEVTFPHTVVVARVPETASYLPELYVGSASGLGKTVALESIDLDRRFVILVRPDQDDNWVRQLFSPAFIDWLAHATPLGLHFEVRDGVLCLYLPGETVDPTFLEGLCRTAAYVAARLRQEGLESLRSRRSRELRTRPVES